MATWLIILLSVGATLVTGGLLGYVLWRFYDRVDDAIDEWQLSVNKLENRFAAAGSNWMAELLAFVVVGDEEKIVRKVGQLTDAADVPVFFLENVALPCAHWAIREAGDRYPEHLPKIAGSVAAAKESQKVRAKGGS
jgi:hypothetical protein